MKFLLFLLLPLSLSAQTFRWQQTLGDGIYVNHLLPVGNKILASSHYPKIAIYISTDEGNTWKQDSTILPTVSLNNFAKDSTGVLYATGYESGKYRIYRSRDEGSTWTYIKESTHGASDIAVDNKGIVYISLRTSNQDTFALLRSMDQGDNWLLVFETSGSESRLENIAIDSKNVIYLSVGGSVGGGLLYSTNGLLWHYKLESYPEQYPRNLFTYGEMLFAPSSLDLYYTESYLSPFIRVPQAYDIRINTMAFIDNSTFYCGTQDNGVHRKGNDDKLREINDGLRHHSVQSIVKTSLGTILCGTQGGGIYRLEAPSSVHSATNGHPIELTIHDNPCQSYEVTVTCSVDIPVMISLSLYGVSGKVLKQIERNLPSAGEHLIDLDVEGLTNGTYLCVLKAGALSVTQNLIVAR